MPAAGLSLAAAIPANKKTPSNGKIRRRRFNETFFFISLSFVQISSDGSNCSWLDTKVRWKSFPEALYHRAVRSLYVNQEAPVSTEVIRRDEFASMSLV